MRALRDAGVDVLTTEEAGNRNLNDTEQLAFAADQGRITCTGNRADFARLHAEWARSGREHAGIVTRTRNRIPLMLALTTLTRICLDSSPGDVRSRMFYI